MNLRLGSVVLYDHHLGDYMRRWILDTPVGTLRLHNILVPDADPDLHCHPWDFASLILRGGYTERVPCPGGHPAFGPFQELHFVPGAINIRRATDAHKIVKVDGSTWTLVLSGVRLREWGFWTAQGWVPWRAYVARQGKGVDPAQYEQRQKEVGVTE